VKAALWLYKASIGKPEIARLGAYFHEPSGRVVLPVINGGEIVYWQARDPLWTRQSTRPKYKNPEATKEYLVAKYGEGPEIVLTEDILSAFRVGDVTEAWSILGTKLTDGVLSMLLKERRPIAIWLDPDGAGRRAAGKIVKSLSVCGVPNRVIKSDKDPKLLSRRQIELVLGHNAPAHPEVPGALRAIA
jgi:DNA primase